jgi:hypothetical protein
VLGAGQADGRGDPVRGHVRESGALYADRAARVAQQADPRAEGASTGQARAHRGALRYGCGAVRRCGRGRPVTPSGVLRFRSVDDLFEAAKFFERQPLPSGRRIRIVSNSAGVAAFAADACATRGLEVREATDAENPLVMGHQRPARRIRCRRPKAAGQRRDRCADGLLRRRSRRRP